MGRRPPGSDEGRVRRWAVWWREGFGKSILGAALFGSLCCALSCAGTPRLPSSDEDPWLEVSSEHFRIRSEMSEKDTREVLTVLEEARAALLATVYRGTGAPKAPIEVVLLASSYEISQMFAHSPDGVRIRASFPFSSFIVLGGQAKGSGLGMAVHELAHEIGWRFLPFGKPEWYVEGAAKYLETMTYDPWRGRLSRGVLSDDKARWMHRNDRLDAERLLAGDEGTTADDLGRFEETAWLLFHYLMDVRPEDLQVFQRRLAQFETPAEAWSEEFPDLHGAELDKTLQRYVQKGYLKTFDMDLPMPAFHVRTRPLSLAEVHGLRAHLLAISQHDHPEEASFDPTPDVKAALAADQGAVEAVAVALYRPASGTAPLTPVMRSKLVHQATRAHPDDERAWLMAAAEAPLGGLAALGALDKAFKLAPDQVLVAKALAIVLAAMKKYGPALYHSETALAGLGDDPGVLALHTFLLAATGNCRGADFYRAAFARHHDTSTPSERAWLDSPCAEIPLPLRTGVSQKAE